VWQPFRSQRTINVWLASAVVGVLLGSTGSYAVMRLKGYELAKSPPPVKGGSAATLSAGGGMPGMSGGMGGMKGMPGMGGGMGGMKGMPGMGGGGPRPKRDLTTLVQKLDLLTGDIGITLTAEQAARVNGCLKDVEKPAKMSDDQAKAKHDQLMAMLNETQKARLDAIGLPRPARGGGPGMGGGMPGMGGGMPGMGGGMPGMMGAGAAPKQDEDQNPFQQDAEGKAVKSLRDRLAPKGAAPKAEAPKASPPKADAPKAPPPKADTKSPAKKP